MIFRTPLIVAALLAAGIGSSAHAALEGRDLDGNLATFEAYYDTVLDITWLGDANYAKTSGYDADGMTWDEATVWAANLSFYDAVNNITYDNWRLPAAGPVNGISFIPFASFDGSTDFSYNITSPHNEMAHLYYVTLGNPGNYTPTGTYIGCADDSNHTCFDNTGPFVNFADGGFWSGTEYQPDIQSWTFVFRYGSTFAALETTQLSAVAVSPGDVGNVAAVPEAETYALLLAGLGLVGFVARRRGGGDVA